MCVGVYIIIVIIINLYYFLKSIFIFLQKIIDYSLILSFLYIIYNYRNNKISDIFKKFNENDFSGSKNKPFEVIVYILTRKKFFLILLKKPPNH
jgi:hypothetical protein